MSLLPRSLKIITSAPQIPENKLPFSPDPQNPWGPRYILMLIEITYFKTFDFSVIWFILMILYISQTLLVYGIRVCPLLKFIFFHILGILISNVLYIYALCPEDSYYTVMPKAHMSVSAKTAMFTLVSLLISNALSYMSHAQMVVSTWLCLHSGHTYL